jgi:vitamin B12 transporter
VTTRLQAYRGRDVMTPGDLASGLNSQGSKDLETSSQDIRLLGTRAAHQLTFTGYHASEAAHTSNVTSFNPADAPFLPFLSFESALGWSGVQARDTWTLSRTSSLVFGLDVERVESTGRNFTRTGAPAAPFSANANKHTVGVYAQHTLTLGGGATVIGLGGRVDRISTATLDTPLKTNFTPSTADFTVFNPSAGLSQRLGSGARLHATIGRAFIPAEASQLTGFTTSSIGGRMQITQGNPDLGPERSTSADVGLEWISSTTRVDVTTFRTVVGDRFISNVVISNPAPPEPIVVSVRNGLDAHLSGIELEAEHQVVRGVRAFANSTHYFARTEQLMSGAEQDVLNVPLHSVRVGVDLDLGPTSSRIAIRHARGAKDNDFNLPGFPIIERDDITVADVRVAYRVRESHAVALDINNLFDRYYYEALGYPLQGASFRLSYQLGF